MFPKNVTNIFRISQLWAKDSKGKKSESLNIKQIVQGTTLELN